METAGQAAGAAIIGFVLTYASLTAVLLGMGAATAVLAAVVLPATPCGSYDRHTTGNHDE